MNFCATRTVMAAALAALISTAATAADTQLAGKTQARASVTVFDTQGNKKTATADDQGTYRVVVDGLSAPLMVVAEGANKQFVAIVPALANGAANTANANALTDRIASDVAQEFKYAGPESMVKSGKAPAVKAESVSAKTATLRTAIAQALKEAGVTNPDGFDPVSAAAQPGLNDILSIVIHNRGYSSNTGERGETSLYDPYYREITTFAPFSLKRAQADLKDLNAPGVIRVFVAGDSTASNYDPEVAPRMGWGQVFDRKVKDSSKVRVINVAQSGRSSRSFITEGWFDMIGANIRKGDYLLVQFGHNDEKCGNNPPSPPPSRDIIDTSNLCTYPGSEAAIPPDMSFQKTLEKYIKIAKDKGATPVLITPVTRRSFKGGTIGSTTHTYSKGAFPGDYSQTVRDTAKANNVALIDLDAKSMAFYNKIGETGSLDYYLAVDTDKYPYYVGKTGARNKPDNTHAQEQGAVALATLIVEGIKEDKLDLANQLQ
ncbi:GDSL-type esterase/lipase family protein [Uliginosibacterium sp. H3]|uniref:GDSL-type esterase/lipase family protein n=1 Tax=Uliginosibacterium silvisoli TaxID=3114758 RepID=A0ABU6K5W8_9RHOO|nr:GDSL-type esterase/lipase family protein [Uliginosibacterium sp. H3]